MNTLEMPAITFFVDHKLVRSILGAVGLVVEHRSLHLGSDGLPQFEAEARRADF